ncbi:MAG: ABC transporter ATP-binding protein [Flavobacteriales bacterium]
MENTEIIKIDHLSKSFGQFQAVKDVSFTVNKGDVFGFLGPNGAGKSTTIRCMLSLIQPNAGQISLFGKDLKTHRNELLSKVGSIIEKPDFYRYLSAEKNLEIFARISGTDVSKRAIAEMLDFVGLNGRGKDKVSGFSHGMKQRLGIAQTLLHQPELIVLDEPTTGLDPQGIVEIRNLILRLKTEQNKTVILSSHQLSEIELISNRMVIINKGQSIVEGNVTDLLNTQEMVVQMEVDDLDKAQRILTDQFRESSFKKINERILEIQIEKHKVPRMNEAMVQHGLMVHALEPKRKLEDFFMKIIQS